MRALHALSALLLGLFVLACTQTSARDVESDEDPASGMFAMDDEDDDDLDD